MLLSRAPGSVSNGNLSTFDVISSKAHEIERDDIVTIRREESCTRLRRALLKLIIVASCTALKRRTPIHQVSKLTLANSQNASDFDELRVRKISTSKHLRVRIINISKTVGKNLLVVSTVCKWKKSY